MKVPKTTGCSSVSANTRWPTTTRFGKYCCDRGSQTGHWEKEKGSDISTSLNATIMGGVFLYSWWGDCPTKFQVCPTNFCQL